MNKNIMSGALILSLFGTAACVTDPETGKKSISNAAIGGGGGAVAGFLLGSILGGKSKRTEQIVGAGIGAVVGGGVGYYLDEQEKKLKARTAGSGVTVTNDGESLLLNMPSGITFDTNQSSIKPDFRSTLDQVASVLAEYPSSYVDIYGHTDSTGTDAINNPLSQRRADAVSSYLSMKGVNSARLATRGFGSTQPVADNGTEAGRQANRRVEIRVVPITQDDVNSVK